MPWRVDSNTGCWMWLGTPSGRNGYGQIRIDGRLRQAHRVMYALAHGAVPPGRIVMHSCDTPLCVNPSHLRSGTHADNMADMKAKGRSRAPRGVQSPNAKMTEGMVREMRSLYSTGEYSQRHLAKIFGISQARVSKIVRGESYV